MVMGMMVLFQSLKVSAPDERATWQTCTGGVSATLKRVDMGYSHGRLEQWNLARLALQILNLDM
jgi:hypothetical protein